MTRTTARAAGAVALALLAVVLVADPARAAAYRYWTYWQAPGGTAAWAFATQGPGTSVPADGDVEGWAFGITTASADPEDAPGAAPDFAAVCGTTPAEPGRKRVALVIDAGPAAVAPDGDTPPAGSSTCVVTAPDATGYEILRSVVEVRTENGLVCGLGGYPSTECAPVLGDEEAAVLLARADAAVEAAASTPDPGAPTDASGPTASGPPANGGSPVATVAVVVGLAAVAGVLVLRRRRAGRTGG